MRISLQLFSFLSPQTEKWLSVKLFMPLLPPCRRNVLPTILIENRKTGRIEAGSALRPRKYCLFRKQGVRSFLGQRKPPVTRFDMTCFFFSARFIETESPGRMDSNALLPAVCFQISDLPYQSGFLCSWRTS